MAVALHEAQQRSNASSMACSGGARGGVKGRRRTLLAIEVIFTPAAISPSITRGEVVGGGRTPSRKNARTLLPSSAHELLVAPAKQNEAACLQPGDGDDDDAAAA